MNFTRLPDLCQTEQQVAPVQGKKENKTGLLSWRVLASLFIAVLFLQVNSSFAQWIAPRPDWDLAQDVVPPCKNCVSEDVKAVDFWFKGYKDLNGCLDSTSKIVSNGLVVELNVTAKDRYGLMFVANLHVDSGNGEKFIKTLYYCQKKTYPQGIQKDTINFDVTALNLKAGFKVTLHDVFVAWDNNKPNGPKGDYLVCKALYGSNTQGDPTTWQFDCTMVEYGAKNNVSLTPRCKRYTDVFLIKTPIRPIIHLQELNDESCFSGSGDGSIAVKVYPLWQQYTYGYIFKWFDEEGNDITSSNSTRTYTTSDLENLSAGDYKFVAIVNVGNKECTDTADFTVGVAPEILDSLSKKNAICDGENGYAFVAEISGGTPFEEGSPYLYYWSSNRNFTDTLNDDNTADTLFGIGEGEYFLSIRDANNCEKRDSITVGNDPCPIAGVFCTYTQGYFGTDNPGKATYDNGDGCQKTETRGTIAASLNWWNEREKTGDSLKIGNINLSAISDEDALERILDYLPGGGPSYQWTNTDFPKSETPYQYRNTLLSQTLTLGLNIGLNKDFADFELPETLYLRHTGSCDGEGDDDDDDDYTTIHEYEVDEDFVGKTPIEIFKAASAALLENTSNNSTRTKYAGIAGFLNEAFDECAAVIDLSEVPGSKVRTTTVQNSGTSNFEVKAYPNPFTNLVNFSFKAPVAGEATVEIFDMTGRRLDIIRKTNTFAGQQNLIQFRANQNTAGQLLYKVTVGNYSVLGKLVNAKN